MLSPPHNAKFEYAAAAIEQLGIIAAALTKIVNRVQPGVGGTGSTLFQAMTASGQSFDGQTFLGSVFTNAGIKELEDVAKFDNGAELKTALLRHHKGPKSATHRYWIRCTPDQDFDAAVQQAKELCGL